MAAAQCILNDTRDFLDAGGDSDNNGRTMNPQYHERAESRRHHYPLVRSGDKRLERPSRQCRILARDGQRRRGGGGRREREAGEDPWEREREREPETRAWWMYSSQFLIKDQSRASPSEQPACLDWNSPKHIKQHLQDALITVKDRSGPSSEVPTLQVV